METTTSNVTVIGSGPFTMKLSEEELKFIAAVTYQTRLGSGTPACNAVYSLLDNIEKAMGTDFMEEAADDVNISVSIVDQNRDIIVSLDKDKVCFEV